MADEAASDGGSTSTPAETAASPSAPSEEPTYQAEIEVGAEPGYVAIGDGSVWVGNHVEGSVSRIDPSSDTVIETIPIAGEPTGMLFAFGDAWTFGAMTGLLQRIDAAENKVVARIRLQGRGGAINGLAAGAGYVWAAEDSGSVYQIDPRTNRIETRIRVLRSGCGPSGNLTFAAGSIWYACWDQPFVWRIDAASRDIESKIRVGPMAGSPSPGKGAVWIPLMSTGVVVAVDPATDRPRKRLRVADQVEQVRVMGGDMWVRASDTELLHVDLKKMKVSDRYELPPAPIPGGGLALGFGSVWAANFGEGTVWRIAAARS